MNPYEIEFISEREIYQIDPLTSNQYSISQFPPESKGSCYEDESILKSLLLHQNHLTKELSIELYSKAQSQRVFFILQNRDQDYFVLSFILKASDKTNFNDELEYLKNNQDKILTWIKSSCQILALKPSDKINSPFPFYKMPEIPTKLEFINKSMQASLINASFGFLEFNVENNEHNHSEVSVLFKIGSSDFNLSAKVIPNFHENIDQKNIITAQLIFTDSSQLNAWRTFIRAMHLRSSKS